MDVDKVSTTSIFPTNIITYTWPDITDFNNELKAMILEQAEKIEGIKYSNAGGYHSPIDLLTWDYPCVEPLITKIQSMAQIMARMNGLKDGTTIDLSLTAWSNIIDSGHYHVPHRHPNNHWSGVYYIDHGDPNETVEHNGYFEFMDPRAGSNMLTVNLLDYPRYQIKPNPGLMVMFPAWTEHFVHPYVGDNKRIAISFNVRIVQ